LALKRLENRYLLNAKLRLRSDPLHPVEQIYLEAIQLAEVQPAQAAQKLEAMLVVFDEEEQSSEQVERCLELARRRLQQLRSVIDRISLQQIEVAQQRMDVAARLAPSEPAQAARIYRGIIQLYEDKPWAANLVQEADRALAELPPMDEAPESS
jgi:hypothetical protein